MQTKKTIIYLSVFSVLVAMLLFCSFLSYVSISDKTKAKLALYETSLSTVSQMETTLYSQAFIISQVLSDMDSPSVSSFQSYTTEFEKYCREEYERTNTVEEIDYVFKIDQGYSDFIDSYSEFINMEFAADEQRKEEYLYYRLTLSPQMNAVFSDIQVYKEYINSLNRIARDQLANTLNRYILLFTVFFFLLCVSTFIVARMLLKRQLAPLRSLIEDQKKFERDKSNFFSTISHEFKTPLTSIVMGADLLLNPAMGNLNDDQSELVSAIKEDSFVLTNLVNNLLQLSKIETADVVYVFKNVNLKEIIQTSMEQFSHKAEKMSINFLLQCPASLPLANVDPDKILWLMNNLLSNAFKYSDEGDSIIISVSLESGDFIRVSVTDQGIGIPEEYSEKIFEKYFQVNDGDRELGGTGLGLAIAKEIIEAHGGRIWYSPNAPKGSIFTFELPLLNQISLI